MIGAFCAEEESNYASNSTFTGAHSGYDEDHGNHHHDVRRLRLVFRLFLGQTATNYTQHKK